MQPPRKILISAYACAPGEGSEPEVGWQWALQMARFHDVTVLTRANNRASIESGLAALVKDVLKPKFVYHDLGAGWLRFKARFKAVRLYYQAWQKSARQVVGRLHQANSFDLMHHLTFATFRYATAVWGHGVPAIWGPVGGIESIPFGLLPWGHPPSLLHELARNASNALQTALYFGLPQRARASTLILSTTAEMQRQFQAMGVKSRLMPTIGLDIASLPFRPRARAPGPLKLFYAGNVITLKGLDLALDALKASRTDAMFTIVGSGNYLDAARQKARSVGLDNRVHFPGRLPRDEVLRMYGDYDVFVFPSLHDTGGFAVIEAMFNELPVVCLDCGGPGVAVKKGCGVKVPIRSRAEIVKGLAAAVQLYSSDRSVLDAHGKTARQVILEHYDWQKKGEEMNELYADAMRVAR